MTGKEQRTVYERWLTRSTFFATSGQSDEQHMKEEVQVSNCSSIVQSWSHRNVVTRLTQRMISVIYQPRIDKKNQAAEDNRNSFSLAPLRTSPSTPPHRSLSRTVPSVERNRREKSDAWTVRMENKFRRYHVF